MLGVPNRSTGQFMPDNRVFATLNPLSGKIACQLGRYVSEKYLWLYLINSINNDIVGR